MGLGGVRPGSVPRTGPAAGTATGAEGGGGLAAGGLGGAAGGLGAMGGGSFLSGALQTAAGVAGGALLFEGIKSLFGSTAEASPLSGGEAASPWGGNAESGEFETGRMSDEPPFGDDDPADGDEGGWGGDDGYGDGGDV
jgi:hypothetical protein